MFGNETVGDFAAIGAFHESFHAGQIHAMKRVVSEILMKQISFPKFKRNLFLNFLCGKSAFLKRH